MEITDAIEKAKDYVKYVFPNEALSDLDLEETEHRNGEWRITVSFTRPRPVPLNLLAGEGSAFVQDRARRRHHKVVIMDAQGEVIAMKDRAWMERTD